jgi:Polyketide cyclase / dehydrase and lipid transport
MPENNPKSSQGKLRKTPLILIACAAIIAALIAIVALQPSAFRITRTATIFAPPSAVFAQVNDFRHWQAWSPWEGLDPAMKRSYDGALSGTGAVYAWVGNNEVGEGRMTIVESNPSDLIRIKLEFLRPFAATQSADFRFKPEGDTTTVTWSMNGTNNFLAQGIGLFVNMDKIIGGQFEKGLAQLGNVVEAAAPEK